MRGPTRAPWIAVCRHCRREVEEFRGLWWRGNDFMCPDGEQTHEPATVAAEDQEEEAS